VASGPCGFLRLESLSMERDLFSIWLFTCVPMPEASRASISYRTLPHVVSECEATHSENYGKEYAQKSEDGFF
jgi:hypothetical protein